MLAGWAIIHMFGASERPEDVQKKEAPVLRLDERQNRALEQEADAKISQPALSEPQRYSIVTIDLGKADGASPPAQQPDSERLRSGIGKGGSVSPPARRPAISQIQFDTLNAGKQTLQLNEIWRIRPASVSGEPSSAIVIDYGRTRYYVPLTVKDIFARIGTQVPLAEFTAPNGQVVYLVAPRITDIKRAIGGDYHPNTRSLISTRNGSQQVQESQEAALKIIENAKILR